MKKQVELNSLRKSMPLWFYLAASIIVPGSGYVMLGKPMRALQMLFFMGFMGFVTYRLSGPDISFIGRFSGAFAVWTLSVVEVNRMIRKRNQSN